MLGKTPLIIISLLVSIIGFWIYWYFKAPDGVTPMGDKSELIAWIALATSIVTLFTAIVGLITKLVEGKKNES